MGGLKASNFLRILACLLRLVEGGAAVRGVDESGVRLNHCHGTLFCPPAPQQVTQNYAEFQNTLSLLCGVTQTKSTLQMDMLHL